MRKLVIIFLMCLATQSFASSDFATLSKDSPPLKALGSAFESNQSSGINLNDDINIVYGGEDMSAKSMSPLLLA